MTNKPSREVVKNRRAFFSTQSYLVFLVGIYLTRFMSYFPEQVLGMVIPVFRYILFLKRVLISLVSNPKEFTPKLFTRIVYWYDLSLPIAARWRRTQTRYIKWAESPLNEQYLSYIIKRGEEFAAFVGSYKRLIDAGCGNGQIGGKTCAEIGYNPLLLGGYVLGIDPLPMKIKPPWVTDYHQAKIEDCGELVIEGNFDKAIIVTSLDHFEFPEKALRTLSPCRELCLWETTYKESKLDLYHVHRFTFSQLENLLGEAGWRIVEAKKVDENDTSAGWFIRAQV